MHITLNQNMTPGFVLHQTHRHFIIQTQPKVIAHTAVLSIDRLTAKCQQITQKQMFDQLKSQKPISQCTFWAIYGIVVVEQVPYLALVKSVKHVTSPRQTPIYQVKDLLFVRFQPDSQILQTPQQKKVLDFINSQLVEDKFYFSYTEDLTQSFKKKLLSGGHETSDSKFFWNEQNVQFLKLNNLSKPWIVPIIQGYVGSIQSNQVEYRLIARRSKHMSGTRYNNRGVNLDGFVSNYVEIEERMEYNKLILTFLSLRGSVPVFWKEEGGLSSIQFPYPQQKCLQGLTKHYKTLNEQYKCTINTINLLSEIKQRQRCLSQRLTQILSQYGSKTYYQFDFNHEPQKLHSNIQQFVESYEYKQSANNFECYNIQSGKLMYQQNFIARVNCLDCIDRTNVICCRIGEAFVKKAFRFMGVSYSEEFHERYLGHWRDLGNTISLIYCGTHSVAEHLTLKSQPSYLTSFTNSFRSATRFFNASQSDQRKQQCNLYLQRQHPKSITTFFGDNIAKYEINPNQYCTYFDLDVCVVTWNVGAIATEEVTESDRQVMARQIFGNKFQKAPGLIFVTLQQVVELNTYNVVSNDNADAKKKWQATFLSIIKEHNPNSAGFTYALYFSQALVGITSFLFAKSSLNHNVDMLYRIKKVFNYQVRRGYGGNLGNKGSIVSGFCIHDTMIVNFASHLAAGDEKRENRLEDVKAVMGSLAEQREVAKVGKGCDFMFFTGDLNFRLSASNEEVREAINEAKKGESYDKAKSLANRKKVLQRLLDREELKQNYKHQKSLNKFTQHPITFYPTYRYKKNGEQHDSKRKPGWCDRILYFSEEKSAMVCEKYYSVDTVKASDHRAVVGWYRLKVKREDKEKKQGLVEEWLLRSRKGKVIQEPRYNFPKSRYNYE